MKIDDAVVRLIVSRSDGCVRDAETLLGQLASLGAKELTLETASLVIPQGYGELAKGLIALWASRDHAGSLEEARRLADEGVPLVPLFDDLVAEVRRMLIATADGPQPFSPGELNDLALLLFERRKDAKSGVDPLFALQLAGTVASNGLLRHARREEGNRKKEEGDVAQNNHDPKAQEKTKANIEENKERQKEGIQNQETPVIPSVVEGSLRSDSSASSVATGSGRNDRGIDLDTVRLKWQAVIRAVDEQNHSLPFILKISRPVEVRGSTVVACFQYAFHLDKVVTEPKNRSIVERAFETVFGERLSLEGVVGEDASRAEARSQDIVSNILKAFGGNVVES